MDNFAVVCKKVALGVWIVDPMGMNPPPIVSQGGV